MNKNILLAAAALSVLATAGAANAASITARAGGVSVTPSAPYTLARELNYSAGITSTAGQFDTVVTTNAALSAGTYTVTLTYSGATINDAVSTTAITQPTTAPTNTAVAGFETAAAAAIEAATLTLSNGGSVGSNTISYTLQIPANGQVSGVYFAPALRVTGAVSVTASITNQVTGQPVDPSVIQPLITTTAQGFAAAATADTVNTDIIAGTAAPRFRTLSTDTTIGTVGFLVAIAPGIISGTSPIAYRDLNGTAVSAADVTGANIVVSGSLTNLNLTASTGTVTKSGNTATIAQTTPAASTTIGLAVIDANGAQLSPSSYTVSGSYTLASVFSGALPFSTTALETVDTEGLTYVVPWVSSRTQGAATGSRTVIRMSRVGTNVTSGGNVYAQILNPLRGTANTNYALVGTLPAGSGELVLSSDTLENAFGDFGRADIRLAVTPTNGAGYTGFTPGITNNLIVKRVIAQPNGGVSEMEVVRRSCWLRQPDGRLLSHYQSSD